ncbi:TetR/AcrR family transcriptional regulator [Pseudoclavibacter albus]|uniref:TetR/AcrR family transcriptional regulator n=1 Tax=Pseudoclavibacter albus TaxID=272241 RepID=UPI000825824D|nr:TetR/AcrR family transcriptional regulator [Pseudoclavibacter alba]
MYLHTPDGSPRERILGAAVALFGQRGYSATTTKAIAEQASVNEVTLFRHFGSKQGILEAIGSGMRESTAPAGLDADAADIRAALQRAAAAEAERLPELGPFALRLAMDAATTPEIAEALGSAAGPAAQLEQMASVFAAWQEQGRVRHDIAAQLLAESFSALSSNLLLTRLALGLPSATPTDDVATLVNMFCDAILVTQG